MPGSMMSRTTTSYVSSRARQSPSVPVVRDVDREALGLEPEPQPLGQGRLVLDDEHAHGASLGRAGCASCPSWRPGAEARLKRADRGGAAQDSPHRAS